MACSGGADSLALFAATMFEARAAGWLVGLVTVDHRLQPGSQQRAERLAGWARSAGADPAEVLTVDAGGSGGLEAAARAARYAALDGAASRHDAAAVLLGHTLDDQAETVLLGLARGSGARSLAGMAPRRGVYRRPLLDVDRAVVRAACVVHGIEPWEDPHNVDPARARARLRHALPDLAAALHPDGPHGLAHNLARTARLLRADADALDDAAVQAAGPVTAADGSLDAAGLAGLPDALRGRVIRRALIAAGAPAGSLSSANVAAVDALVTDWHGQRAVSLPRGVTAAREHGRLQISASP